MNKIAKLLVTFYSRVKEYQHFNIENYCQAQFKFSPSKVQFELRLSLKPGYYHLPTLTPTLESRDTVTFGLPRALKFGMEALFNQTRSTI